MANTNLQGFLRKLNKNYQILREREAHHGSVAAPLWLINQIEQYQKAIWLIEQALEQNISVKELQAEFVGLNLEIRDQVQFKPVRKPFDGRNPYRGLEKFTENDHEFFCGRSAATAELVTMTQSLIDGETSPKNPALLAVIGASGSGKSSLVRAGLIPALRAGRVPGSERQPIRVMIPGPQPLDSLAQTFVKLIRRSLRSILDDLRQDKQGLHYLIKEALAGQPDGAYLTLVIDQFEELFTLCESETERRTFIDLLVYTANHPHHRGLIILTMRADFYGQASQYPRLAQVLTVHQHLVAPLTRQELREAILLPAEAVGLEMEKELALALVQDTVNEPGALPLLQHTLLELFNRRTEDHVLTMAAYQKIGGVRGALAHRANSVLAGLDPDQQDLARNIFLRLTTLGEGAVDTRRRVNRAELYPAGTDPAAIDLVLQALSAKDARLVVADEETVEVTHEALIQQWGQLREWLETNRDSLRLHRRVTEAAKEWVENEQDSSYLFRGARLTEVEEWVDQYNGTLTPEEWAFVSASIAEREQVAQEEEARHRKEIEQANKLREAAEARQRAEEQRAREAEARAKEQAQAATTLRRRSQIAIGVGTLAIIAAIVAVFFFFNAQKNAQLAEIEAENAKNAEATAIAETERAERQAQIALSRQLAAQSANELNANNYELALLLAIEAGRKADTVEAFAALRRVFAHPGRTLTILSGHTANIRQAMWNGDESRILTASGDRTAKVWDAETGEELLTLAGHTDWVRRAEWNADESRILTASGDGTARVWNAETGEELLTLAGHTDWVRQAVWNADESRILTASGDGTARVWNAETGQELLTLVGHMDLVNQAEWNADESRILTASDDGTAQVWDAETGQELLSLIGHTGGIRQAMWNADESRILTTSADTSARVWNAETGEELLTLSGHTERLLRAVWNGDESRILTASADGTARVWDAETGQELLVLSGHTDRIWHAAWNANETRILTASGDGTARVWDAETGEELLILSGHTDWVRQADWNADESRILTHSGDGTARVWSVRAENELLTLSGHGAWVRQVLWNADESRILTASDDGTAWVWDAATGAELLTLSGHKAWVWQAEWNGDESRILTASGDGTARVWDAKTGAELVTLSGHTAQINHTVWNADGSQILTAGEDGTARVWDAEAGDELLTLSGHTDRVMYVAWNGDESRILTASGDGTARVWDAKTGTELVILSGHTGGVNQAVWNADESRILT